MIRKLLVVAVMVAFVSAAPATPPVNKPVQPPKVVKKGPGAATPHPVPKAHNPFRGSPTRHPNQNAGSATPEIFLVVAFAVAFFVVLHIYRENARIMMIEQAPTRLAYELVSKSEKYGTVSSPRRAVRATT